MFRAAARAFASFELVNFPLASPRFRCTICGVEMVASRIGETHLPLILNKLLDHRWLHHPESVGAPDEEIDARVDGLID